MDEEELKKEKNQVMLKPERKSLDEESARVLTEEARDGLQRLIPGSPGCCRAKMRTDGSFS